MLIWLKNQGKVRYRTFQLRFETTITAVCYLGSTCRVQLNATNYPNQSSIGPAAYEASIWGIGPNLTTDPEVWTQSKLVLLGNGSVLYSCNGNFSANTTAPGVQNPTANAVTLRRRMK